MFFFQEINKSFAAFSGFRSKSPEVVRTQPTAEIKIRRSKSAIDIRGPKAQSFRRNFKPTFETIPAKRLKPGLATMMKPLPIKTAEKKAAILTALKSSSASAVVTIANKKPFLTKTTSQDGPSTSKPPLTSRTQAKPVVPKSAAPGKAPAPAAAKPAAKTARPAPYDFKARHALLLEKYNVLKAKNDEQRDQLSTLEEKNEAGDEREKSLEEKLQAVEQELADAREDKENLKREIEELKGANGNLQTRNKALAGSLAAAAEELSELKVRQVQLEETAVKYENLMESSSKLRANLEDATSRLAMSQGQLYQINMERMVLHNQVLDLRGNIRVFARVRPPIAGEDDKQLCTWTFPDETSLEIFSNELVPTGGTRRTRTPRRTKYSKLFHR